LPSGNKPDHAQYPLPIAFVNEEVDLLFQGPPEHQPVGKALVAGCFLRGMRKRRAKRGGEGLCGGDALPL
jgi:hypothetical protein